MLTEFLVRLEVRGEDFECLPVEVKAERRSEETARARQLFLDGSLVRLWRDPSVAWGNIGIWRAADLESLNATLATLPMWPWLSVTETVQMLPHPNDPGA